MFFQKKYILALGAGGIKGLAHIGAIKALEELGIKITAISGSSVGAIIGAYYAAHLSVQGLENWVMDQGEWLKIRQLYDLGGKGGMLKGDKISSEMEKLIGVKTFSELKIPFTSTATDLDTGQTMVFSSGELIPALRASISVPGFFMPAKIDGRAYADGGLTEPIPVQTAKQLGKGKIIAVNLDAGYFKSSLPKNPNITQVGLQSMNILRYRLSHYAIQGADYAIEPDISDPSFIGLYKLKDKEAVQKIIQAGEDAARKVFG
jgi:NTE family protein